MEFRKNSSTLIGILLGLHLFGIYNPLLISLAFGFYLFWASLLWGASSSRALQCYEEQRGAASSVRNLLMIGFFAAGGYLGTLIRNDGLLDVSIVLIILSISSIVLHFATVLENQRVNLVNNT